MRIPLLLFGLALLVRLFVLALFPDPAYVDSYYYVEVARSLAAGHGFSIDFIWTFVDVGGRLPADPTLPIPSNAHWMPLASLVQVPFLLVLGPSAWASALPFALIGALAAPLAWAMAREAGARPTIALAAGVLTAIPGALTVFLGQPDNFAPFEVLAAASLWMVARGLKGSGRSFAFAGLLVGLATLSRNDGVLLGVVLALAVAWDRWHAWRSAGARRPRIPLASAVVAAAAFLVVMGPWWVRQLAVFGSISPSSASGRILWITELGQMNSITTPVSISTFFESGFGAILSTRIGGLIAALGVYLVICSTIFLAPFLVVGAWRRRRSVDFGPYLTYAVLLFAFSSIVSAVHVPNGTFLHSAVALVPGASVLALEGVAATVAAVARRRRSWDAERATRVFVWGSVILATLGALFFGRMVLADWESERRERVAVADELERLGVPITDRLMSVDTGGSKYHTGRGGVVTVNDPLPVNEEVARAYDVRWLVLQRSSIVPPMVPVLEGRDRPAWIGEPVWTYSDASRVRAPSDVGPDAALYPVCVLEGDDRCGATP